MKIRNYILPTIVFAGFAMPAGGANVSRIDVSGTKRMDAESVRILTGVNVGDNVGSGQIN